MSEQPEPDDTERISQALTEVLGLHGGWVLAVEVYDADGEANLHVIRDCGTIWAAMGMIEGLRDSTRARFETT